MLYIFFRLKFILFPLVYIELKLKTKNSILMVGENNKRNETMINAKIIKYHKNITIQILNLINILN